MVKTSSVITGSATAAAAALAPLIDWIANERLNLGMPSPVVLLMAAGAVTAGHFLTNLINELPAARAAKVAPTRVTVDAGITAAEASNAGKS